MQEYVIVDRFKESVLVLTWRKDGYRERRFTRRGVYKTPLLPGLAVRLSDAFA